MPEFNKLIHGAQDAWAAAQYGGGAVLRYVAQGFECDECLAKPTKLVEPGMVPAGEDRL